jgi:hypothetical protein
MSLHEIMKGAEPIHAMTYSILETKKLESKQIESQIEEYLAKGNKISEIPTGITSEHHYTPNEFNGQNNIKSFDSKREVSARKCRKATMNSKFYPTAFESVFESDVNRNKYVVIIGKYISKQFDNIIQACNHRDYKRRL